MPLDISAINPDPAMLDLPWSQPLEDWPDSHLAALPRGISRHVVRFVRLSGRVVAIKEITEHLARREFQTLRTLRRMDLPAVKPLAVVSGRTGAAGQPLDSCLVTQHLRFSLPYRAVFSQRMRPDTARRTLDALAVLLVRLHLAGCFWGDVSLSNTLFRRDAGDFAAYLVDAETAEIHPQLSDGQRQHDLTIAHGNIAGELMDLEAAGLLDEGEDPVEIANRIMFRYDLLWRELTSEERFEQGDRWRVEERIRRLNNLGFDVDELEMTTDVDGASLRIQPRIVDAGHHSRRLMRLTGLDVEENQARRLLNDLDSYRAATERQGDDESLVAHDWVTQIYEPVTRSVPPELRGKLEPAEFFHEILEHRWYLSERAGHDTLIEDAVQDYVQTVLPGKPDEAAVLGVDTEEIPIRARPVRP
ncbi:DUF4032 domain-containing protein [Ornithinimicrobium pratense]|uniref:DUF4032 domain-containing protein n=1 Tax=Ornithinimicrobium pratense TaxID=2593973 RepID=A0A5J6V8U7_9MICO|nr:DUF4032 domain-containing protein [Ornithinimicrobium pratense]QFG69523.1 DUF4032 domain-containing protein [Ornithinimicrobium pratense]